MKKLSGFTLIEIAIVLVILAMVTAMLLSLTKSVQDAGLRSVTTHGLSSADAALTMFVMANRRLPCPADGQLAPSAAGYGVEQRDAASGDCLNAQARGVVPWTTMGISVHDVTDGYGGILTYRAALGLTRAESFNFTGCDPGATPGNLRTPAVLTTAAGASPFQSCVGGCTTATIASSCTTPADVIAARGIEVRSTLAPGFVRISDPTITPSTGAAYALWSHGANHSGGYTPDGVLQEAISIVGTDEGANAAGNTLVAGTALVDGSVSMSNSPTYYDDAMSHPTVMTVATGAGLAPRVHN